MQTEVISLDRAKIMLTSIFDSYYMLLSSQFNEKTGELHQLYQTGRENQPNWEVVLDNTLQIIRLVHYANWHEIHYSPEYSKATQYIITRKGNVNAIAS